MVKSPATLTEDPGLVSRNHMVAHKYLYLVSGIQYYLLASMAPGMHVVHIHTYMEASTYTCKMKRRHPFTLRIT